MEAQALADMALANLRGLTSNLVINSLGRDGESMRWWDDAEIVLLAHTGNVELAEQFAAWCQSADETLLSLAGIDADTFNNALTDFVRGTATHDH